MEPEASQMGTQLNTQAQAENFLGSAPASAANDSINVTAARQNMPEKQFCVACVWNEANALRVKHGLPMKDLHISLGARATAHRLHSLSQLLPTSPFQLDEHKLIQMCKAAHHAGLPTAWAVFATELCRRCPDKAQSWCILADAAAEGCHYKLAMTAYHLCWSMVQDAKVQRYCIQGMTKAAAHTSWGPFFTAAEFAEIPECLQAALLGSSWGLNLYNHATAGTVLHATAMFAPNGMRLPRFISWVLPFRLAASATPKSPACIAAIRNSGIKHVYTLTEEEPLPISFFTLDGPKHTFSPLADGRAPTFAQVDRFLEAVAAEDACVLVHCGGGKGRAGTFAACCLAMWGSSPPFDLTVERPVLSAQEAVRIVRNLRPGSIETQEQEAFVQAWVKHRWRLKAQEPVSEPKGVPLDIQGHLAMDNVDLVMLVGLPGAGKSWFAQAISKRRKVTIISQDESRSRSACETQLGASVKTSQLTILDRCNASRAERRVWLDIAGCHATMICVEFCYSRELCLQRGDHRLGHPTLRPGRMTNAMDQMAKDMQPPSLQEGFGAVAKVGCYAAAFELVLKLGGAVPFHKFPRTEHLVDLGAATSDDVILTNSAAGSLQGDIAIEEKVDGGCMGISLASDFNILVQNRSRYINAKTHAQFVKLGLWIESHRHQLLDLLNRDDQMPERFMLFGEWVAATHAIHYTALPDLFLAFDLYDRLSDEFVSRPVLAALLKDTDIKQVPVIMECTGNIEIADLCQMTNEPSVFHDGPVEGVYIRIQKDGKTLHRYKIVRANFTPGNSDWGRKTIMNKLQI
ncbi:hypothetical protein WJX77_005533 [Trebouxia sp. C0004]